MSGDKTKNDWQVLIDEQIQSGLSKIKFCQQKGIATSRFYYYLNLLRPNKKKKSDKILAQDLANQIVPVKIQKAVIDEPCCDIRLRLKNGLECILPGSINKNRLKEIIEVLILC
jgi:hypothetical protein